MYAAVLVTTEPSASRKIKGVVEEWMMDGVEFVT